MNVTVNVCVIVFAKGSVESTHKQGTQGTDQPLPHETLPRSGRVTRWTNTPVRIFKDPAPTPIPAILRLLAPCQ